MAEPAIAHQAYLTTTVSGLAAEERAPFRYGEVNWERDVDGSPLQIKIGKNNSVYTLMQRIVGPGPYPAIRYAIDVIDRQGNLICNIPEKYLNKQGVHIDQSGIVYAVNYSGLYAFYPCE